jgi:hypothetical protein
MSTAPTVVVRKGGALSALVSGVFATLIVCIVCAAALGWYTLSVVDRKASEVLGVGQALFQSMPEWRDSLPPALADMLHDRRAPEYRAQLDASAEVVAGHGRHSSPRAIITVTNKGAATVTLLTARIVLADEAGHPQGERRIFIATPLTLDEDEWRGPLLPGTTRRFSRSLHGLESVAPAALEITDVRVWSPPAGGATPDAGLLDEAAP